jgi:hypothetical protein
LFIGLLNRIPWRSGQRSACLVLGVAAACHGTAADSSTNDLALIPEDTSLWHESLLWDKNIVVKTGVGYKDNVLLAPSGVQGSGFFTSGIDLSLIRLPPDGWGLTFTVVGDDVRYFRRPGGLGGEDLFAASLQGERYFGEVWRAGLELRGSYVDQVLQVLLLQGGIRVVEAKGETLGVRPFLRRDLSTNWWVQMEAPLARDWWQSPLDPTWKFGGGAVLGYSYRGHSQVSLTGEGFYLPHDEWQARDAVGIELAGKRLALWREVAELKWEHQWDAHHHWTTVARAGLNHNHDNGGGFYNFYRYYLSGEVQLHAKGWQAKVSAGWSYYDFPIQTVDVLPSPRLHLDTVDAGARLERKLYKGLGAFASFEYEQTASDDPASEYRYKVVTGGLSWEF